MKQNNDKEDMPEFLKAIIDKAMANGADVDIIKLNRKPGKGKGKEKEKDKIIESKLRKDTLDTIDELENNLKYVSKNDLLDRLGNSFTKLKEAGLDTAEMNNLANRTYMQMLSKMPTPPSKAISIIVNSKEDCTDVTMCGYKIDNNAEAITILRNIANSLEEKSKEA